MNTNSPFFITTILSGLSLVVAGWAMLKYPPKSINAIYGYRTRRSKSSQEAWDFAQPMSARLLMRYGAILTMVSFVGCFVSFGPSVDVSVALALPIAVCMTMWCQTENALANRFTTLSVSSEA